MTIENPREPRRDGASSDDPSWARTKRLMQGARSAALLSHRLAMLDIETKHRLAWYHSHYNPNQPRVPAGHPDGGQWTKAGGGTAHLAASEKLPFGPNIFSIIFAEAAKRAIEQYRKSNNLRDLFDERLGTVTWARLDGKDIFGSNSDSPTYTRVDRVAAETIRDVLIRKYPNEMATDSIGRMPNNTVFHAETTILLRAARERGGTLAGRTLVIYSDRVICNHCPTVLPKIALELGNPAVVFIDRAGRTFTVRDGKWLPE
jgi:hypothetical protein